MADENAVAAAPKSPLPANEKTITIEYRGEGGKLYAGDFTIRRLSVTAQGRVGAELARLNGGNKVDPVTEFLNTMLAHFPYAILKAPDWWDPNDEKKPSSYDVRLMKEVFDAIMAHEQTFRPTPPGQVEAAGPVG